MHPSFSETHPSKILNYCPKCGVNGFSFDNTKLFACKSCGFNFYINPAAATCGIIELPDGHIILARRKFEPRKGTFDLPGGFVDIMERAETCIVREIKEELGIDVEKPEFLASFPNEYVFKGISYFTCDLAFVFKLNSIPNILPADDVAEAIFINPADIEFDQISFPSIVQVLKTYLLSK